VGAASNKCNITSSVAALMDDRAWGTKVDDNVYKSILENYRVYLGCLTDNIDICYPDICEPAPQVLVCGITISSINASQTPPTITFTAQFKDPNSTTFSFEWTYNTCVYSFISDNGNGTIVLKVNPGVDTSVSGEVGVTITDEFGCSATKTCCLISGVMQCDCVPCSCVCNLVVTLNTDS
jgi:hypothetical protein